MSAKLQNNLDGKQCLSGISLSAEGMAKTRGPCQHSWKVMPGMVTSLVLQKGKILLKDRNVEVLLQYLISPKWYYKKNAITLGHCKNEISHVIPLQGKEVSLPSRFYLGLSLRSGLSCSSDSRDTQAVFVCAVPQMYLVSSGTEHCLA